MQPLLLTGFWMRISKNPLIFYILDVTHTYHILPLSCNLNWDIHTCTLTAIGNLTGYLMTAPIPDKKTSTIAVHLFLEIFHKFGFLRILHSDNGTEFKSKLIEQLTQLLDIKKTYIFPHQPQSNGKLESFHRFRKDCMWKFSINGILEWDQLLLYATTAFNWVLNENFQESPHFLYFGCDSYLPHLATFLQPKLRYTHMHSHSNWQPHRLPYDSPHPWQKDFNHSCSFIFGNIP